MSDLKYNGWTNWETLNFKLWIDNNAVSYYATLENAEGRGKYELAKELKLWTDDMIKNINLECGFFADVCNSAIKEVNFNEIAQSYIDELHWDDLSDDEKKKRSDKEPTLDTVALDKEVK